MKIFIDDSDRIVALHNDDDDVDLTAYGEAGATRMAMLPAEAVGADENGQPALVDGWQTTFLAGLIKSECSGRINAVLRNYLTQINMTAAGTALARKEAAETIDPAEQAVLDLLDAGQVWVRAMQTVCRDLIIADDTTYENDSHWPAAPAGLDTLAADF